MLEHVNTREKAILSTEGHKVWHNDNPGSVCLLLASKRGIFIHAKGLSRSVVNARGKVSIGNLTFHIHRSFDSKVGSSIRHTRSISECDNPKNDRNSR